MRERITFADNRIEWPLTRFMQSQKIGLHELDFVSNVVGLGSLAGFAQHPGTGVSSDHLKAQLRQRNSLCAYTAGCVQYTLNTPVAENRTQAQPFTLKLGL